MIPEPAVVPLPPPEASPISDARRAAEAFFSPPTVPEAPIVETPVVVRRKRLLAEDAPEAPTSPQAPADVAPRAPKVFILPPVAAEPADPEQEGKTEPERHPTESREAPVAATTTARPRRQRRQLHGKVTILRPNDEPAAPADSQPQHTLPFADVAAIRTELLPVDSRYVQLLMQLQAAHHELELTKANETAAAIQWIRQAMLDYDLGLVDLGLR